MAKFRQKLIAFITFALAAISISSVHLILAVSAAQFEQSTVIRPAPIEHITQVLGSAQPHIQDSSLRDANWPLQRLGIPQNADASNVRIGICDTGGNVFDENGIPLPEFGGNIAGGWNCFDNNSNFRDVGHHGTDILHVLLNQDFGGLKRASVFVYRISDSASNMNLDAFDHAVERAFREGVRILLCSWGARIAPPQALKDTVAKARKYGMIIIAASGNDGIDVDADHDLWSVPDANVLHIAASSWPGNNAVPDADTLDVYSDYGHGRVDLAAPGQSLGPGSTTTSYHWMNGTSIAVPWVGVEVALVWAQDPTRDWRTVRKIVISTVVRCPHLATMVFTEGRAAVDRALEGNFNPPLDSVGIQRLKLKKAKKLSFSLNTMVLDPTSVHGTPIYRVYADDELIGILNASGDFSIKGKFAQVSNIQVDSSEGGTDKKSIPN
jgi:subtilisin family serine protease